MPAPPSTAPHRTLEGVSVLVLATAHRAGPWACRSLADAGARVVGAHHAGLLAGGRSSACVRPLRYPFPARDPAGFLERVVEICRGEGIDAVLPAGEDEARVLAEHQPDLRPAVVIGPDPAQYEALCDKLSLGETAARAGVDHPETVLVTADGPSGPMPPLPSIVKPRISGEDMGEADAAVRADTAEERDAAVAALVATGRDAVVQQHVSGTGWIARCVRGPGVFEIAAFRVHRQYPRAAGTPSMQTATTAGRELHEASRRIFDVVDYRGPGSACFIESGGRLYLHDVNLRLSGTLGGVMRSGLDVPRRVVELALGRSEGLGPPQRGRRTTYVRLDGELSALGRSLRGEIEERPGEIVSALVKGAVAPNWMLDPSPVDPFWLSRQVGLVGLRLARGARARLS